MLASQEYTSDSGLLMAADTTEVIAHNPVPLPISYPSTVGKQTCNVLPITLTIESAFHRFIKYKRSRRHTVSNH